jgi:hypothetical protein
MLSLIAAFSVAVEIDINEVVGNSPLLAAATPEGILPGVCCSNEY